MELEWLTTEQAAQQIKVSVRRMQTLLKEDRIDGAIKMGRQWMIPAGFRVLYSPKLFRNVRSYHK